MKFCTECGHSISRGQAYCKHCGVRQLHTDPNGLSPLSRKKRAAKRPLKKRTKTIIGIAVLLTVLLMTSHQYLSNKYDFKDTIKAMDAALTQSDAEAFFEHIKLDEKALLNKNEYMKFLEEAGWEGIREQLVVVLSGKGSNLSIKDHKGNELFTIEKDYMFWKLYPKYTIIAKPQFIKANTNLSPTTLIIEEQSAKVEEGELKEAFTAYPGEYKVKGEAKNEFGRFEYADDIYVGFSPAELFIEFPDQTYTIQTDQPDATLIINGKSTSKTLSEFEELGPFPENEVVMYAERTNREGKIERTEEVTQNDTVWGSLPFDFNQEDYEYEEDEDVIEEDNNSVDAGNYVMEFRNAYEEALNAVDYSYISSYLIEGSEAALELQDYLTEIDSQGYTFNFTHNEVTSLEQMDEETSIVTTNERFTFTDQDGKETFYDRVKDYTLISMDNGLKITSIDINETIRN